MSYRKIAIQEQRLTLFYTQPFMTLPKFVDVDSTAA